MKVKQYKLEDGKFKYLGSREDDTVKTPTLEITAEVEATKEGEKYFRKEGEK